MPRPRTALPLLLATALAGCAPAAPAVRSPAAPPASPSPSPACVPAPLERRAAAVLVVGLPDVTTADAPLATSVVDLGVGGVFLSHGNVQTAAQVRALADGLRARAGASG